LFLRELINRIKHKLKSSCQSLLFSMGVPYKFFLSNEKNVILMYHGVCEKINPFNSRHCYLSNFEKQIRYLKRCSNIISVEDFFDSRFDPNQSNVAITFDDGYKNNLSHALPILEKYNVKASVYITGLANSEEKIIWADLLQMVCYFRKKDFVLQGETYSIENRIAIRKSDKKSLLNIIKDEKPEYYVKQELFNQLFHDFIQIRDKYREQWELLTDNEIIKLSSSPLITIGSHAMQHNNLGNIEPETAINEIKLSQKYLENLTQKPVSEIAFPDGSYSHYLLQYCSEIGLSRQLISEQFKLPEDRGYSNLKTRYGIYQSGNWSEQIIPRLIR
jgi:peptidoglycan/xylan/chitin deacetylase (PgdA/CDA1 family)